MLLAIEGYELLSVGGIFYNDLMTCDSIEIIGMHRLSVLFHHVVCDIYDVIYRADTLASESLLHPLR